MDIDIHGKQVDLGDTLRTHIEDKLNEIDSKYFNHGTSATVTITKEGHGHGVFKVTISYLVSQGVYVNTEAEAGDPYAAFEAAAEKAAKRLRRNKKRLRDHHDRGSKTLEAEIIKARDYVIAVEGEDPTAPDEKIGEEAMPQGDEPAVIAEMSLNIETLAVADAVMRMDLSGDNALVFRNAASGGLNIIYRRSDGNIGWIDPDTIIEKKQTA